MATTPQKNCIITIHGHRWEVKLADKTYVQALWSRNNPKSDTIVDAFCDFENNLILICEEFVGTKRFSWVLWHEITHAVLADIAQIEGFQEEVICDVLGREMPNLIEQAKKFPKWWLK